MSQPFVTQVRSIAACLPEQFMRMRDGSACSRTSSSRVAVSPGHAGGQPSASSPRPAAVEDVAHDRDVTVGAGVARRGESEPLALERARRR